jgi:two-component system response regulator YesN
MKKWFWLRFFYSYLFVFLFTAVSLIVIFLLVIAHTAKEETLNANGVYARTVMHTFDDALRNLDQTMIRETLTNTSIKSFYNPDTTDQTYANFLLYSRIRELISSINGIDSIYLYRTSDNKVMSDTFMLNLSEFADKDFIQNRMMSPSLAEWTAPRPYVSVKGGTSQQVVSLVKGIPFGTAQQGLLVINLSIPSLQNTLMEIAESDVHYAYFTDEQNAPIFNLGAMPDNDLSTTASETTHWVLHTGIKEGHVGGLLSLLSYSWLYFVIIVCLIGIALLIYVARKHYKPIELITDRIQHYVYQGKSKHEGDQFAFIERSIDKLITESQIHEEQAAKDSMLKKDLLFREYLSGTQNMLPKIWQQEILAREMPEVNRTFLILLIEIDHFDSFSSTFSQRDQLLLKFALHSAVQEMTLAQADSVWLEWLSGQRLCHLVKLKEEAHEDSMPGMIRMCEEWRTWIQQYLKLTVTIGVGELVTHLSFISHSYDVACEMLDMKASIGPNSVISQDTIAAKPSAALYDQLENIRTLIHSLKTDKEQWKRELRFLFAEMKASVSSRKTIVNLTEYLQYHVNLEITDMADEIKTYWREHSVPQLSESMKQFTAIDELEARLYDVLSDFSGKLNARRELSPHFQHAGLIKAYIEAHYADPNLSLNQISEHFQLSASHFSLIFKEVLGEKFVDYLTRIRVEHAKEQLTSSDMPIQEVALQVGYVHSISFIRVFKKHAGMTPGDYRKRQGAGVIGGQT